MTFTYTHLFCLHCGGKPDAGVSNNDEICFNCLADPDLSPPDLEDDELAALVVPFYARPYRIEHPKAALFEKVPVGYRIRKIDPSLPAGTPWNYCVEYDHWMDFSSLPILNGKSETRAFKDVADAVGAAFRHGMRHATSCCHCHESLAFARKRIYKHGIVCASCYGELKAEDEPIPYTEDGPYQKCFEDDCSNAATRWHDVYGYCPVHDPYSF